MVKLKVEKFRQRFNGITVAVVDCLILCQIAVAKMPMILTQIKALGEHRKYLKENLKVFAKCETHPELFANLNLYWNYLAYDLLYQLIEVLTGHYTGHSLSPSFTPFLPPSLSPSLPPSLPPSLLLRVLTSLRMWVRV